MIQAKWWKNFPPNNPPLRRIVLETIFALTYILIIFFFAPYL